MSNSCQLNRPGRIVGMVLLLAWRLLKRSDPYSPTVKSCRCFVAFLASRLEVSTILPNKSRNRNIPPSIRLTDLSDLPDHPTMYYCDIAPGHPWHGPYHDREYGFPIRRDNQLFGRLILEINQAGLSWLTILKKREAFRKAYDKYDVERVAGYGARDRRRLMADAGIIRNRLKIDAAIANAARILELRESHGSFHRWLQGAPSAARSRNGSSSSRRHSALPVGKSWASSC